MALPGLMGAGRTELAMSVFGRSWGTAISADAGAARRPRRSTLPSDGEKAIDAGLAYVTEDRKQLGLMLADDIRKNITLANLDQCRTAAGNRRHGRVLKVASDYRNRMRIRCSERLPGDW